jgi:jumonji domain-containing protein 7
MASDSAVACLLGAASRDSVRAHWAPRAVPRVHVSTLTEASFLRDFVAASRPVVLLGATAHWRARALLANDDWRERLLELAGAGAETDVHTTPTGRGDAAVTEPTGGGRVFVMPQTRRMPLRAALDELVACRCGVPYLSAQDDNVRKHMPGLLDALGGDGACAVATAALGGAASVEAINVWIGASPAIVSTTHKDHYNNTISVLRGVKRVCLLPPADVLWVYERRLPVAGYEHDDARCLQGSGAAGCESACWRIARDEAASALPWICVDPERPDLSTFPLFTHASPVTVDVAAGETLFLPGLWHHQVSHPTAAGDVTIAINTWQSFDFNGIVYATYALLREAALLTTRSDSTDET